MNSQPNSEQSKSEISLQSKSEISLPSHHLTKDEESSLKKVVAEMDEPAIDNTEYIRETKHSIKLSTDIQRMEALKHQCQALRQSSPQDFSFLCQSECKFFYDTYPGIFHKLIKDEINLTIMQKFLYVMRMIEDGKIDQNQGSIIVGKLLKELYLDSAVRRGENLDRENGVAVSTKLEGSDISWKEYKNKNKK